MEESKRITEKLESKFWSNIEEKIGKKEQDHSILYHYSSLESLMGMIETNKIWMSKGTFLNDSNELVYITNIIDAISEEIARRIQKEYGRTPDVIELQDLFVNELDKTIERFKNNINLEDVEVFVLSLTTNQDSLALWYNYAKGDGYNLGFSSKEMLGKMDKFAEKVQEQYNFLYGQVVYDRDNQQKLLMDFLMDCFSCIFQECTDMRRIDVKTVLADHLFFIMMTCSVFFKNHAFKSEEEYRIAFLRKTDSVVEEVEVLFRSQNGVIIPFIMVDFAGKLPICEVTIGPKNNIDVAQAGIEHYLKGRRYDVKKIAINKSVAELRY